MWNEAYTLIERPKAVKAIMPEDPAPWFDQKTLNPLQNLLLEFLLDFFDLAPIVRTGPRILTWQTHDLTPSLGILLLQLLAWALRRHLWERAVHTVSYQPRESQTSSCFLSRILS